jgi:hypothetical protein
MITKEFPELKTPYLLGDSQTWVVDPFALLTQIPIYASPGFDCCSWDADFPVRGGGSYHIYSWDTMGEIVKSGGFDYTKEGYEIEISAK